MIGWFIQLLDLKIKFQTVALILPLVALNQPHCIVVYP